MVFRKKEVFEEKTEPKEDETEAKVTKNKIPKRIRLLMKKRKNNVSRTVAEEDLTDPG